MSQQDRLPRIKAMLLKQGRVDVREITKSLGISEPTARRDVLKLLQTEAIYRKIRNGISLVNQGHEAELRFEEKIGLHTQQKKQIAKQAAQLIQDYQKIMIDSGTTAFFFAKELLGRPLHVVTADLRIAYELSKDKNIHLYVLGGEVRSGYYSLGGVMSCQNINSFCVDTLIMSADAFSLEHGVTNIETFEVPVKQALLASCKDMILLMDSSKIGQRSFYKVAEAKDIHTIITDNGISPQQAKEIEKQGVKLIITHS
ncbi:MAG: DeoR/GlpR family DNA-binding transcription regulator [Brevinema sp.]